MTDFPAFRSRSWVSIAHGHCAGAKVRAEWASQPVTQEHTVQKQEQELSEHRRWILSRSKSRSRSWEKLNTLSCRGQLQDLYKTLSRQSTTLSRQSTTMSRQSKTLFRQSKTLSRQSKTLSRQSKTIKTLDRSWVSRPKVLLYQAASSPQDHKTSLPNNPKTNKPIKCFQMIWITL